jgi:hypothetical protein
MTPELKQFDERDGDAVSRYEYDDQIVYAADIGPGEAAVDVVDNTVMLVRGDEQAEFDVPEPGTAEATINNGVLTVEVER